MLQRRLEPEVMDTADEAVDYDSMDHREVNRRFVDDLLAAAGDRPGPWEVLDLGTGTAQIPIELCGRRSDVRVRAVDAAAAMLEVAAGNVARAGLAEAIRLERVDAKRLPYPSGTFSIVMSNSIVHHIPRPAEVLAEAVRVTAVGGLLFFRDLLRPGDLAALDMLVDTYTAGGSTHQRQMFADSLHAALSLDEVRELVAALGFESAGVRATSDRHWTWQALRKA